jgi:hypothetical protein
LAAFSLHFQPAHSFQLCCRRVLIIPSREQYRPQSIIARRRGRTQTVPPCQPELVDPAADLARCFLRLANLPNFALDRLSRYEATLWRQVSQTLFALDALDRCKPQDGRRLHTDSQPDPQNDRERTSTNMREVTEGQMRIAPATGSILDPRVTPDRRVKI